jgi:hypothetical protein
MNWDVIEASLTAPATLHVRFCDGLEGIVTFQPSFFRGVFAPLGDEANRIPFAPQSPLP